MYAVCIKQLKLFYSIDANNLEFFWSNYLRLLKTTVEFMAVKFYKFMPGRTVTWQDTLAAVYGVEPNYVMSCDTL